MSFDFEPSPLRQRQLCNDHSQYAQFAERKLISGVSLIVRHHSNERVFHAPCNFLKPLKIDAAKNLQCIDAVWRRVGVSGIYHHPGANRYIRLHRIANNLNEGKIFSRHLCHLGNFVREQPSFPRQLHNDCSTARE